MFDGYGNDEVYGCFRILHCPEGDRLSEGLQQTEVNPPGGEVYRSTFSPFLVMMERMIVNIESKSMRSINDSRIDNHQVNSMSHHIRSRRQKHQAKTQR